MDWRESVLSALHAPSGLAGLSPFRPPGTLRISGFCPFRSPGILRTSGTQVFQPPGTLRTGGTVLSAPGDSRDSVLSGPHVPWGLAGLSPVSPSGTLGTGRTQSFQVPRYQDWRDSNNFKVPWGLSPPKKTGTGEPDESGGLVQILCDDSCAGW